MNKCFPLAKLWFHKFSYLCIYLSISQNFIINFGFKKFRYEISIWEKSTPKKIGESKVVDQASVKFYIKNLSDRSTVSHHIKYWRKLFVRINLCNNAKWMAVWKMYKSFLNLKLKQSTFGMWVTAGSRHRHSPYFIDIVKFHSSNKYFWQFFSCMLLDTIKPSVWFYDAWAPIAQAVCCNIWMASLWFCLQFTKAYCSTFIFHYSRLEKKKFWNILH